MQGLASDKTFHLKWNNHLQNLSQLFTTIYSSSALADVTLSCRDGTLKAHKLVLSACSPYFEQIFKDNPCQHPIVILKGIPFSEINLLVEFMYKGSVDVQELDLQSLMHTASELEIRGLAYEARDNAAQMLNVNLEYPTSYPTPPVPITPVQPVSVHNFQSRTDIERLKQIHMYQQSMMRAEEMRRRRRDETQGSNTAVNNILAAAAREMEEVRNSRPVGINISAGVAAVQTEQSTDNVVNIEPKRDIEEKKRTSILTSEEERLKAKKKPQMTVRFQEEPKSEDTSKEVSPVPSTASSEATKNDHEMKGGIKVVQLAALQKPQNHDDDSDGGTVNKSNQMEEDEETDSSDSVSDTNTDSRENRPHVCDVCDLRFQRSSHLSRHRLTHTGERPFTCGGCGRSFARSDKLRVHNKICEREDPTVDLPSESNPQVKREKCEVMSGMVRSSHRESGHLVFTAGGDVTLPPRAQGREGDEPARRGRGRPRKTPLPLTPKVKKRRGRPPKTSLDMEGCVLTSGSMMGSSPQLLVNTPAGQQLLLKRKRGRPPKTYMMTRPDGRPNENYNATNLPFGDFSYLTDMMYLPTLQYFGNTSNDNSDRSMDIDQNKQRSIDLSDSSSDDEDNPKMEIEEHPTTVGRVMTVGDCQIVKLPSNDKQDVENDVGVPKTPSSVTITPITTVGDCTIRPVENNT